MASKDKTDVATVNESAQLPAGLDMDDLLRDSGSGVAGMGMDDVAVPYLYILQQMSPQVDPDNDAYVEGAKPGMFYNNVNEEIYEGRENGVIVIPCAYERKYVEWVDRDSGGGYVADHDIDSGILSECTPNEKGIPVLKNGHLIVETAYHYVYMKNPLTGVWEEIIIPMKSTMLKKSRRWNKTLMATLIPGTSKQAPRWLYPYRLRTVKETKNNNTWSNYDIERLPEMVTAEQYRACKAFAELFSKGLVTRETDTGTVIDGSRSGGGSVPDEEMPF
jgi:hypothetical protein